MKVKSVLLGLTAAAVSGGVAFAQMQPIPNPPATAKPAVTAKHHAKKAMHHKKKAPAAAASKAPATTSAKPASGAK